MVIEKLLLLVAVALLVYQLYRRKAEKRYIDYLHGRLKSNEEQIAKQSYNIDKVHIATVQAPRWGESHNYNLIVGHPDIDSEVIFARSFSISFTTKQFSAYSLLHETCEMTIRYLKEIQKDIEHYSKYGIKK